MDILQIEVGVDVLQCELSRGGACSIWLGEAEKEI
jgi:hypothetical protein